MNRYLLFIFLFLQVTSSSGQTEIIKWPQLDSLLKKSDDTLYVFNFWATWCKPCVAELPEFMKAENELKNQPLKFIYVSLDFKREFNSRLIPFTKSKMAGAKVYLLDEPDYDSWISKVEESWMGEIPVTLFVRNKTADRKFHNAGMSYTEIIETINTLNQ